jgi:uncharacterized protein YkwD
MPFSAMRRLLVLAVALAAVSAPATAARTSSPDAELVRRAALEREIGRELNRARTAHGLRPLRFGDGLRTAAATHSRAMLEQGFFEHESADGTSFADRIRRYYRDHGWGKWSVGETLLASSDEIDARRIVTAWIQSRSHREVLFAPDWRDGGVGVFYSEVAPGTFGRAPALVVTADFGLRTRKSSL